MLNLSPGPGLVRGRVVVQLQLGMSGEIKRGRLEQAYAAGRHAFQPGGNAFIHELDAGLVARGPALDVRVIQVVEHPHPDVGLFRRGLLQGAAQGGLGQQVRKDHAAGQQGHRQQNAQQQHQLQLPVGRQAFAGDNVCQVQQRQGKSLNSGDL